MVRRQLGAGGRVIIGGEDYAIVVAAASRPCAHCHIHVASGAFHRHIDTYRIGVGSVK